jgi:FtsP/CotA-like multicopper oxidase with cupredoxin domain
MTVVAADGQNIQPVTVDEFRMGTAEIYDVIITPEADRAYSFFAQNIDRTGFACASITTNPALRAPIPELDPPALLGHQDMGMGGEHANHTAAAIPPTASRLIIVTVPRGRASTPATTMP